MYHTRSVDSHGVLYRSKLYKYVSLYIYTKYLHSIIQIVEDTTDNVNNSSEVPEWDLAEYIIYK